MTNNRKRSNILQVRLSDIEQNMLDFILNSTSEDKSNLIRRLLIQEYSRVNNNNK